MTTTMTARRRDGSQCTAKTMSETAQIYALDPDGDPRVDALCDDIEEYAISVTADRGLPFITAIGALDLVRYRMLRYLDDGH